MTASDCRTNAPQPDGNYRCERPGPLATATQGGRVRYRGSLADPNELSLALAMALPFALALFSSRRARGTPDAPEVERVSPVLLPPLLTNGLLHRIAAFLRSLPAVALLAAVGVVVVLSRSRSGLLAFLTVLAIQAIRRLGGWGIVAGCFLAPPLLVLGGRSGVEADESADERVEILREAFELIRSTKGIGLGAGQFSDASSIGMTAHNAYVLAAAEAGLCGLVLFTIALYLSLKVPVVVWLDGRGRAARFAPAIATAMSGAMVGVLFLSWAYKDVLYLLMGASAALASAAHAEDGVRVRLSAKEAVLCAMAACGLLAAVYVGARMRH